MPAHPALPTASDRRRTNAVVVLAQVAVFATALVNWIGASLTFFGNSLDRWDYLAMVIGFAAASLLLVLSLVPARALRCSRWVLATAVVLSGTCLVGALIAAQKAGHAEPATLLRDPWGWAVEIVAWSPANWGMVVLVAATPLFRRTKVRGSLSPGRRPLQAR